MIQLVHIVARGRVQGVGYRAFVQQEALLLGVAGWVRNCGDGTVEAVFAADEDAISEIVTACRRGPRAAHVEAIDQREAADAEMSLRRPGEVFSVLPTAL